MSNSQQNQSVSQRNKTYQGYLLDLDGTIYRGTEPIPEAIDFVHRLQRKGLPFLFLTNNSSKTQKQVADKLRGYGLDVTEEHVYTSSMAAARYLIDEQQSLSDSHLGVDMSICKTIPSALIIGEDGLLEAMEAAGIVINSETPTHVIMGIDRQITYEKLAIACLAIRKGARLLATNLDRAIPTERGLLPGNGSLVSVVTTSTGVEPIVVGKPNAMIAEFALEKLGVPKEQALMVGDNYDTDICTGFNAGIDSLMVFTGLATREEVSLKEKQPTYQLESLCLWEV